MIILKDDYRKALGKVRKAIECSPTCKFNTAVESTCSDVKRLKCLCKAVDRIDKALNDVFE